MFYLLNLRKKLKYFMILIFLFVFIIFSIILLSKVSSIVYDYIINLKYDQASKKVDFIVNKMPEKDLIELIKCNNKEDINYIYDILMSIRNLDNKKYFEKKDILKVSLKLNDYRSKYDNGYLDMGLNIINIDFYFMNVNDDWKLLSLGKPINKLNNKKDKCQIIKKYSL